MQLTLVLVHNKSDQENIDQINQLKAQIITVTEILDDIDDKGTVLGTVQIPHYELKDINTPHKAKFIQIIPFGTTQPNNFYDIDSENIIYKLGAEDKIGQNPHFFNHGLVRGTDNGANTVIQLTNMEKLDFNSLEIDIQKLDSKSNDTEFVDSSNYKISGLRLLLEVGGLDETKSEILAVAELKQKVTQKGWING